MGDGGIPYAEIVVLMHDTIFDVMSIPPLQTAEIFWRFFDKIVYNFIKEFGLQEENIF